MVVNPNVDSYSKTVNHWRMAYSEKAKNDLLKTTNAITKI